MDNQKFKENIVDYLYQEIKGPELEEAHRLREKSDECREEWNRLIQVRSLMKSLPEKEVPLTLQKAILKKASVSQKNWLIRFKDILKVNALPKLIPASVVTLLIVGFVSLFWNISGLKNQETIASQDEIISSDTLQKTLDNSHYRFEMPEIKKVAVSDENTLPNTGLMDSSLFEEKWENQPMDLAAQFQARQKILMEEDADRLLMRGRRYKSMGRIDLALRDFETIFRFYPEYTYMGDVLMHRAQCYAFQGQPEKAINSLTTYMKRYPEKEAIVIPMIQQIQSSVSQ